MKVIIAINEPVLAQKIENYVRQSGHTFAGKVNLDDYISNGKDQNDPDILISAIDDAEAFNKLESFKNSFLPVLFVDNEENLENYTSSKDFKVSRYIVDPFPMLSLKSILDELQVGVHHLYSNNYISGKYIFVRHDNVFKKINIAEIAYMYSEGNYTNIFIGEEKYIIKYSLSKLLALSNFDIMIRIHRNHAVQKKDIGQVDFASRTLISQGMEFPFGRTYTKQIRKIMKLPKS